MLHTYDSGGARDRSSAAGSGFSVQKKEESSTAFLFVPAMGEDGGTNGYVVVFGGIAPVTPNSRLKA